MDYTEIKNPGDMRAAYRRSVAVDAERMARIAEADLDAVNRLRVTASDFPFEVGSEAAQRTTEAQERRLRADSMRQLAGITDVDYPWPEWLRQFRETLAAEEETHLRNEDVSLHSADYAVDPNGARYQELRSAARVEAMRSALADIESHMVPPATTGTMTSD